MTQESPKNRESFIFYRSFFESMEDLNDKNKLILFNSICNLALNGVENELKGQNKNLFTLIKPQIVANRKKQIDGKKGGRPKLNQDESDACEDDGYIEKEPVVISEENLRLKKNKPNANANANANANKNTNTNTNTNASNEAILVIDYFNLKNNATNTGDKSVINGLNIILKDYTIDDVKLVIDYMLNSITYDWQRNNGYNTLSSLSKSTKFYEKLEKAQIWKKSNINVDNNLLGGMSESTYQNLKEMHDNALSQLESEQS